MVKHIVMFKFLEEAQGKTKRENAAIAKEKLDKLMGVVPGLLSITVELNAENADPDNYDLVLISEHEDWEGLAAYITHPNHVKIGEFMKGVRESRTCVDFES